MHHLINEAARLVTITASGDQLVTEARAVTDRVLADTRLRVDFRVLIAAHASLETPTAEEAGALSGLVKLLRTRIAGRIAIVAPTAQLANPARYVSLLGSTPTLAGSGEVRAFLDEAEARKWVLGDSTT
jgi:hypothetical protein